MCSCAGVLTSQPLREPRSWCLEAVGVRNWRTPDGLPNNSDARQLVNSVVPTMKCCEILKNTPRARLIKLT